MKLRYKKILFFLVILFLILVVANIKQNKKQSSPNISSPGEVSSTTKISSNSAPILIGIEYAVEGQDAIAFGSLGLSAIKPLPENINWSKMQPKLSGQIDYSLADKFVKEYQNAGFKEIVFGLRTLSHSDDNKATYGKNRPVPKPEYMDEYVAWVKGMVERYDKDGINDMPGLKHPVRYYEIEVEFSSYTPEPVDEYLGKLKAAYKAAHEAYPNVVIAHSAFLALTAFDFNPLPSQYEKAFASMYIPDKHHNLADMRKVLDHPELFDRLNFHELGDPIMIERTVQWLKYETSRRGYSKQIIISDTAPTGFAGYGRATSCTGSFLGIVVWPAKESDRCRIADYFNKILDNDATTIAWKNWYIAGDMVKKVVIAAASDVELINTAFTGDLPVLNTKFGFAGAGNGGFGGIVSQEYNFFTKKYIITEYRPGFYALKQVAEKLKNATKITREPGDADVRLYKVETPNGKFWIGWLHPDYLVLPGDPTPKKAVSLPLDSAVTTEMASTSGIQKTQTVTGDKGVTNITLTMSPVYIASKNN